jgi:Family of unknown function (DUF6516)
MKAIQILCSKEIIGNILVEMVAWHVLFAVSGCQHLFKYRFYAGRFDGACLVRYDNERGKGDHKHIGGGLQEPYHFTTLVNLKNDFMHDVQKITKEQKL